MIKSVYNYPVSQLFDTHSRVVYAIPRYQREYTWGKSQWENLFDDVQENDPGYFLGSIICINQTTGHPVHTAARSGRWPAASHHAVIALCGRLSQHQTA